MPEKDNDQIVQATRTRATDARFIYTDSMRLAHSPFDIRLHFGLLKEAEPGIVVDEEQAVIIMSPQHAKAMLNVLTLNMKKWEDKYGEIPAPDDKTDEVEPPIET